jgi:RHS repeat-associated protein
MEGLGEKFQPQINTGDFTYQIPLKLPPVRGGAPSLALEYNPGNENGTLGLGWALRIPCIQRQTDKGLPQYIPTDLFCDENAEELVHLADGSYRQKIEGLFIHYQQTNGGWAGNAPNGTTLTFGSSAQSQLNWGNNGTFCWMLDSSQDPNGNLVKYFYFQDAQQIYPSEIRYGLNVGQSSSYFSVQFSYLTNRPDAFVDCRPRFECTNRLLLQSVTVYLGSRRIRQWQFGYDTANTLSLLSSVTEYGDDRSQTGSSAQANVDYLPPTTFGYTAFNLATNAVVQTINFSPQEQNFSFDNEGFGGHAEFVDINHDGLPDILINSDDTWRSLINPGIQTANWPVSELITNPPFVTEEGLGDPGVRLVDLNGDGKVKLAIAQDYYSDTVFQYYDFLSPATLGPPQDYETINGISLGDSQVQFVDLDDDKAIDVLRLNPASGTVDVLFTRNYLGQPNVYGETNMPAGVQFDFTQGWKLADINGDRLLDMVQINGTDNTAVCLNTGWGNFAAPYYMTGGPDETELEPDTGSSGVQLVDLNQDGLADLVIVENGEVEVWINQDGTNWDGPIIIQNTPAYETGNTAIRFADINGNGSTDIIWHQNQDPFIQYIDLFPSGKAYLLNSARTTLGRSISITYSNSTDFLTAANGTSNQWSIAAPFSMPVMAQVVDGDGMGGSYTNEFSYANDYFDPIEHQFRGFEDATKTELGNDAEGAPTLITLYEFDDGITNEAMKGKPLRIETDTDAGGVFYRQTNTWLPQPLGLADALGETRVVTFAFQTDELIQEVELGAEANAITLERAFNYDNFGNQIFYADYGIVSNGNRAAWNDERLYVRQFSAEFPSGANLWLLDRLVEQDTEDINSNIVAKQQVFYDDPSFGGNNLGSVSLGNPTLVRDWINITNKTFRSTVRRVFDGYGNVVGTYDPLGVPGQPGAGHYRQIAFDPQIHTHPVTETIYTANPDAIAAGTGQPSLTMQANYDVGLGVMTNAIDFNGNNTYFGFDTFGRLNSITKPYDTASFPTATFSYFLQESVGGGQTANYIETDLREVAGQAGKYSSRSYFDGLGRKMMTRSQSDTNGVMIVNDADLFNQREGVWRTFLPYFESGTLDFNPVNQSGSYVETDHDALGRETVKSQPPTPPENYRAFSQTAYGPLTRLVQDEEQTQPSSPHFGAGMFYAEDGLRGSDGHGRLRQVEEIVHLSSTGQTTGGLNTWLTQYNYDTLDDFLGYIDSQGNQKFFQYDALMRKTFMNDPDRGVMQWSYDPASNVTNTVDAKGQQIGYTYDGANRLQTETYFDGLPMPPWRPSSANSVIYHYDVPFANIPVGNGTTTTAQNTLGKLAWVQDLSGEEHTSYDARGRVAFTIKRLPDPEFLSATNVQATSLVSYQTAFQFDSLDRTIGLTYPDGDAIGYTFNQRNLLNSIQGGVNSLTQNGNVIQNITYAASGQLASILYGNGILTQYGYDPRLRLSSINTAPATNHSAPLIAFGYVFDDASNIKSISDNRPTSAVAAGDPRRNNQVFGYDDLYRITSAGYGFSGPGDLTSDNGTISYAYDQIGNMLRQISSFTNTDSLTGLPTVNLGQMSSGGSAGTDNRVGRSAAGPPGPHALTSVASASSNVSLRTYPYDANGNMTIIDDLTNTWDFKDRLVAAENSQISAAYLYDYTDRRVAKIVCPRVAEGQPTNVLYINKYFEVREYDQPTKFVWNGNTRVARVVGSLSNNQRIQRIRLWPGMNLASVAVNGASLPLGLVAAYQWNPQSLGWQSVSPGSTLAAGAVLWIQAATNTTITFAATYSDPSHYNVSNGASFLPSTGLEVLSLSNMPPQLSTNQWQYDAKDQVWQISINVPFTNVNASPSVFAPGQVLMVRADAAAQMTTEAPTLRMRYYHQDHLGSVAATTDSIGILITESANYPFGLPRIQYKPRFTFESYGFIQRERDFGIGLDYFHARYMEPVLDRFITTDLADVSSPSLFPVMAGLPQRWNSYSYALNRATIFTDERGDVAGLDNLVGGIVSAVVEVAVDIVVDKVHGVNIQKDAGNIAGRAFAAGVMGALTSGGSSATEVGMLARLLTGGKATLATPLVQTSLEAASTRVAQATVGQAAFVSAGPDQKTAEQREAVVENVFATITGAPALWSSLAKGAEGIAARFNIAGQFANELYNVGQTVQSLGGSSSNPLPHGNNSSQAIDLGKIIVTGQRESPDSSVGQERNQE